MKTDLRDVRVVLRDCRGVVLPRERRRLIVSVDRCRVRRVRGGELLSGERDCVGGRALLSSKSEEGRSRRVLHRQVGGALRRDAPQAVRRAAHLRVERVETRLLQPRLRLRVRVHLQRLGGLLEQRRRHCEKEEKKR